MFERHEPFMRAIEEKGVRYIRVMPKEDDPTSAIGRGWKSTFNCQSKGVNALFMYVCMYVHYLYWLGPLRTVHYLYSTAYILHSRNVWSGLYILTMCSYSVGSSLYMTSVPIHQRIGIQIFFH